MEVLAEGGLTNLCRLCGEDSSECLDLFDQESQGSELLSKIELSVRIAITEGDGLPSGICGECQDKLLGYTSFYQQCHDTQERLQEFLSIESAIYKTELNDYDEGAYIYEEAEVVLEEGVDCEEGFVEADPADDHEQEAEEEYGIQTETKGGNDSDVGSALATTERKKTLPLRGPSSEQNEDIMNSVHLGTKENSGLGTAKRNDSPHVSPCSQTDLDVDRDMTVVSSVQNFGSCEEVEKTTAHITVKQSDIQGVTLVTPSMLKVRVISKEAFPPTSGPILKNTPKVTPPFVPIRVDIRSRSKPLSLPSGESPQPVNSSPPLAVKEKCAKDNNVPPDVEPLPTPIPKLSRVKAPVKTIPITRASPEVRKKIFERSRASNPKNREEDDMTVMAGSLATLPPPLTPLQLYDPLDSESRVPTNSLSIGNALDVLVLDDSEKTSASFRKEMDVLLCGDTDSRQTVSQLSCCSESRPLTSPSFTMHAEDFSLDQGDSIPISEFPLPEERQLTPVKSVMGKEGGSFSSLEPVSTNVGVCAKDSSVAETQMPNQPNSIVAFDSLISDASDTLAAIDSIVQLEQQQVACNKKMVMKECNGQFSFAAMSSNSVITADDLGLASIETSTSEQPKQFDCVTFSSKLRTVLENHAALQIQNTNCDVELMPSLSNNEENLATSLCSRTEQNVETTVLTVDARVIGLTGEIKFQRSEKGTIVVLPPTPNGEPLQFEKWSTLLSNREVQETFCTGNNGEGIIQKLVQQGSMAAGPPSGRNSSLSQTSSLDFPSLVSPALSTSDSWSWEISRLLDETSSQGDDIDSRSELNTPIVTLPPKQSEDIRRELNTPIVTLPSKQFVDVRSELNTPVPILPTKHFDNQCKSSSPTVSLLSKQMDLSSLGSSCEILLPPVNAPPTSFLESYRMSPFFPISQTKDTLATSTRNNMEISMPQRVFTPLQVQIPDETDTPVRMSRTLQSCSTYFEGISLGISPVIDLDPNVATVRMSCPPTSNSQESFFKRDIDILSPAQSSDTIQRPQELESCDTTDDTLKHDDCDIKTVAIDILIDDGTKNWQKILPDPTDEFIKKISRKCYKCQFCSVTFKHMYQVQRHIKIKHSTAKPYICSVCSATFSVRHYLTRHMKVHGSKQYECTVCSRKFMRQSHLNDHEKLHSDLTSLKCTTCGKQSNSKTAFYVHKNICSGKVQSYVCDICGKSFEGLTALNHHRARHEVTKKFKCHLCASAFHTRWQLVNHIKKHDVQGLETCPNCTLAFASKGSLVKHMSKCPARTANELVCKENEV